MSLIGTRSLKLNESGQGVLEYILVLTITVFLIGTFLYQFSTAFRKYANNFFGEYVACLMETGELPGNAKGECQQLLSPFNLADGKTSTGRDVSGGNGTGGIGSGSGGNGSGSGSGSGAGQSGRNGSGRGGRGGRGNGSDGDGGGSSGSSGPPAGELGVNSRGDGDGGFGGKSSRKTPVKTASGNESGGADGKKDRAGLKPVGAYSSTTSGSGSGDGRGRKKMVDRGFGFVGQDEQERREEERPATKPVAKDQGDGLRPKKVAVNATRAIASEKATEDSGFSIGNFLRVIIIAGILIAIFILFGGQLLAISKGGEK